MADVNRKGKVLVAERAERQGFDAQRGTDIELIEEAGMSRKICSKAAGNGCGHTGADENG